MGTRGRAVGAALVGAALLAACTSPPANRVRADPRPGAPPPPPPPTPLPTTTVPPAEPAPPPPSAYLPAGVHEHHVQVDDHLRRWTTVVPEGSAPSALVVVLHGVGARGVDMRFTGFESRAAVVAYPDGLGGAWNDGRPGADPVVPGPVDDVRFLRLVIEETTARTGVDPRRVAVVGFSNGGIMAGRVACELADGVAAVALVGGSGGHGFERTCRPARPVAVMLVAGSGDRAVPYGGGRVPDWGTRRRGFVAPVEDVFAFWRASAGCSSTEVVAGAPPPVNVARGAGCRAGASVIRYRVGGGGHEWFRAPTFDTTGAVWDFMTRRFSALG